MNRAILSLLAFVALSGALFGQERATVSIYDSEVFIDWISHSDGYVYREYRNIAARKDEREYLCYYFYTSRTLMPDLVTRVAFGWDREIESFVVVDVKELHRVNTPMAYAFDRDLSAEYVGSPLTVSTDTDLDRYGDPVSTERIGGDQFTSTYRHDSETVVVDYTEAIGVHVEQGLHVFYAVRTVR